MLQGWSERASRQFQFHLAKSTRAQYNSYIKNFIAFCKVNSVPFPCNDTRILADYLCFVCDKSARPKSVLCGNVSALNKLFDALSFPQIPSVIHLHVEALIKSGTLAPMIKTATMPIDAFYDMFNCWPDNEDLSLKDLRLKCICLLALVFMARPSDFAPKAELFDPISFESDQAVLTINDVQFLDNGMSVTFHGIKNDYVRDGFKVVIPGLDSGDAKIDPIPALQVYISKTHVMRACTESKPLFLTLRKPYKKLDSSSVANVLNESIARAGLKGFSAKCFRPTGASKAISMGLNSDTARHIGRWKCAETFEKHYVHRQIPADYSKKLLLS